jgi:hypothetical protein
MHLTNKRDSSHTMSADSNESAGAPEHEIEITPAMIQRGVEAFFDFTPSEDDPEMIVAEVYRAMALERERRPF